jgi:hypothetical protein
MLQPSTVENDARISEIADTGLAASMHPELARELTAAKRECGRNQRQIEANHEGACHVGAMAATRREHALNVPFSYIDIAAQLINDSFGIDPDRAGEPEQIADEIMASLSLTRLREYVVLHLVLDRAGDDGDREPNHGRVDKCAS